MISHKSKDLFQRLCLLINSRVPTGSCCCSVQLIKDCSLLRDIVFRLIQGI